MNVKIGPSDISDVIYEALPLMHSHFDEVHYLNGYTDFDPDIEHYLKIESAGFCKMFTVFLDDVLIGYSTYFVRSHMHCKGEKHAFMDTIYIKPDHRGSGFGKELIAVADEYFSSHGCTASYVTTSARLDFGPMITAMGYELMDKTYARRI